MKNNEMESTLRKIKEATEFEIGGWQNQLSDYSNEQDSEEYQEAKSFFELSQEEMTDIIYRNIVNNMEKEVRFAGKDMVKYMISFIVSQSI